MYKLDKTVIFDGETYTQNELTRATRNLSSHVKHAIKRKMMLKEFAHEFKAIAEKVKAYRKNKEELEKQLELPLP